jgi:LmbE family N-acetylglucosaminyl deacetylase
MSSNAATRVDAAVATTVNSYNDASLLGGFFVPDGASSDEAFSRVTTLAIGAHQDDIEFMAMHGVLECYAQPQRCFAGVICTDGGGSPRCGPFANYSDDAMRAVRVEEQNRAAAIGRYSCMWQLGATSAQAKTAAARAATLVPQLQCIVRACRPRVVYTHNPADKHDTHVSTLIAVLTALRSLPRDQRPTLVYGCEVWRDLDWLCDADRIMLDVSARPELSREIVSVFDSQINGGKRYDDAISVAAPPTQRFSPPLARLCHGALIRMDLTPLLTGVPDEGANGEDGLEDALRQSLSRHDRSLQRQCRRSHSPTHLIHGPPEPQGRCSARKNPDCNSPNRKSTQRIPICASLCILHLLFFHLNTCGSFLPQRRPPFAVSFCRAGSARDFFSSSAFRSF